MGQFQKLDDQQIAQLSTNLIKLLPKSSALYNVTQLYLAGTLDKSVPTSIFAYDGIIDGENAFVVAKQFKKYYNSYIWVIFGPTSEHVTEHMHMSSALEHIVDWTKDNSFTAIHPDILTQLGNSIKKLGTLTCSEPVLGYYMEMKEKPPPPLIPIITTVRDLNVDEAAKVVKYWKYAEERTLQEVRDCISFFDSTGLLVNNELVCWACHFSDGSIHALYTMEEHRGKGYGKLVLQDLAAKLATKGMYATTQVEGYNQISAKLMASSGFTFSHSMRWTEFRPFSVN